MNHKKPINETIFAIDFDGTCVTHEYPEIGRSIGAEEVLTRIVEEGGKLILWTMRSDEGLDAALTWFYRKGIPLHGAQSNPTQKRWTASPKCYAHTYIDDASLGCPLVHPEDGGRPYADWPAIEKMIFG